MPSPNLEDLILEQASLVADQMNHTAVWASSEEEIRYECNKLIDAFLQKAGLKIKGRHEYGLAGGRIDSKYAGVIIEYKDPKGAGKITENEDAPGTKAVLKQIKQRFKDFQREEHIEPEKLFGVGTDGDTIVFVRQRGGKLEVEDPQPTTRYTVERLLRALVSLGAQGKSFTPDHLTADFGSDSPTAQQGVRQLYKAITETDSPKARTFFNQVEVVTSREQIGKYAGQLERCIQDRYSPDEFIARCQEEGLPVSQAELHRGLFAKLQELDKGNQNGIWARIIKNAFAPLFIAKVDYVAGNPPWVNWQHLPEDYRRDIAPLWQVYDAVGHHRQRATGDSVRAQGDGEAQAEEEFVRC